jgi:hypothetical protein
VRDFRAGNELRLANRAIVHFEKSAALELSLVKKNVTANGLMKT